MNYTCLLREAAKRDTTIVGGKAKNLGILLQHGFKVPAGFCVLSTAYQGGKLLPAAKVEIEQLYHQILAGQVVAVRSSGVLEDSSQASFAGQGQTVLNVTSLPTLFTAIERCLHDTVAAQAYRLAKQLIPQSQAIIVQQMVQPQVAGVLFTMDPTGQQLNSMIVEATTGLADQLVAGHTQPSRWMMDRTTNEISRSIQSELLTTSQVQHLCQLAQNIEQVFGAPQDIEWAIAGEQIYIIQARPITTTTILWSNLNTAEILPDVATPMTWSILHRLVDQFIPTLAAKFGVIVPTKQLIGRVAGRIYFNLNVMYAVVSKLPVIKQRNLAELFGGTVTDFTTWQPYLQSSVTSVQIKYDHFLLKLPGLGYWFWKYQPARADRAIRQLQQQTQQWAQLNLTTQTVQQLLMLIQTVLRNYFNDYYVSYAAVGLMYSNALYSITKRWLGDVHGAIAHSLLSNLGTLEHTLAGTALADLANNVQQHLAVHQVITQQTDYNQLKEQLLITPNGQKFITQFEHYLMNHGHHTRGELEVANPRWREMPNYVLGIVRSYLTNPSILQYANQFNQRAAARRELTVRCLSRLRNPFKKIVFRWILHRAQAGTPIRENIKNETIKHMAFIRTILIELGQRLVAEKKLAQLEDVFFLELDELNAVTVDTPRVITQRRQEYNTNLNLHPPALVLNHWRPTVHEVVSPQVKQAELIGLGVSSGKVRGCARVILKADQHQQIQPGEILVAPFTDPGWTPYFLPAAGIVVEVGGILSHGSIIAREFGIPAVVNINGATSQIQSGQWIEVDGDQGLVRLLS